jgi:hypothetical protein
VAQALVGRRQHDRGIEDLGRLRRPPGLGQGLGQLGSQVGAVGAQGERDAIGGRSLAPAAKYAEGQAEALPGREQPRCRRGRAAQRRQRRDDVAARGNHQTQALPGERRLRLLGQDAAERQRIRRDRRHRVAAHQSRHIIR